MRLTNQRIIRLANVVGGAIIEPGDGELILPALLQQTIELADPLARVHGNLQSLPLGLPGGNASQTFMKSESFAVAGALAGVSTTIAAMNKGLWRFQWTVCQSFTGTTNIAAANRSALQFIDPDINTVNLCDWPNMPGANVASGDFFMTLERDGFLFSLKIGTTIAGDNSMIAASIYGKRIA